MLSLTGIVGAREVIGDHAIYVSERKDGLHTFIMGVLLDENMRVNTKQSNGHRDRRKSPITLQPYYIFLVVRWL